MAIIGNIPYFQTNPNGHVHHVHPRHSDHLEGVLRFDLVPPRPGGGAQRDQRRFGGEGTGAQVLQGLEQSTEAVQLLKRMEDVWDPDR